MRELTGATSARPCEWVRSMPVGEADDLIDLFREFAR